MDKDIAEVVIVEFGHLPQYEGIYMRKVWGEPHVHAYLYYYPEDITLEEAKQEIEDLEKFYDGLGIATPVPKHLEELCY